ncbi:MAG: hypothetical protein JRN06_08575 [Nitrososphaerota archaeon]|nr:hypothetical protein [Nitrososphaerota archaeon]MDG7024161.1 hypothetical protein [Nitrososphaerota archaeon]
MQPICEWCGQPAVRLDPTLCAERYYKFWSRSKAPQSQRVNGTVYSE